MKLVERLQSNKVINPPHFVISGLQYLCITGSIAYGVADNTSDWDLYGFSIPPKEYVFPHLGGEIQGFSTPRYRFDQWQQHHIQDPDKSRSYDFQIYSIIKFFKLTMDNNPNMVDCLFVPDRCVQTSTAVGKLVRDNRDMFLHKGSFHKFKGYAYSQLHKMRTKTYQPNSARAKNVEEFGYDVKFAYHLVRLLHEAEQILVRHTLDLEENREQLKSIRRGEWKIEDIEDYFHKGEARLEQLYVESTLRNTPDEESLRNLLMQCLEEHYGSIDNCISMSGTESLIKDIERVLMKYKGGR